MFKKLMLLFVVIIFVSITLISCSNISQEDINEIKAEIKEEMRQEFAMKLEEERVNLKKAISEEISKQFVTEKEKLTKKALFITEGLTKEQVIEIMGTPDTMKTLGQGGIFYYGNSSISFDFVSGKVDGWDNKDNNLKLK